MKASLKSLVTRLTSGIKKFSFLNSFSSQWRRWLSISGTGSLSGFLTNIRAILQKQASSLPISPHEYFLTLSFQFIVLVRLWASHQSTYLHQSQWLFLSSLCCCSPTFISPIYFANTIHHLCSYFQFSHSCLDAAAVTPPMGHSMPLRWLLPPLPPADQGVPPLHLPRFLHYSCSSPHCTQVRLQVSVLFEHQADKFGKHRWESPRGDQESSVRTILGENCCSPWYTWKQLFRNGSCAVRSHHWFLRDKASSIQTQITDFSCQMLMLLLSQGKLRYFSMLTSGLNVSGFPRERAKDTFLSIPGSSSKGQRN